jgi:(p)ppGpp synthase/HD superfamily hydrolase
MSVSEDPLLKEAERLACLFYAGKTRSGSDKRPYITHPQMLVAVLIRHGITDPVTLAAAMLHDAVEETGYDPETIRIIRLNTNDDVADLVLELTDVQELDREARRAEQIDRALRYTARATWVRLADKHSNLTDLVESPPRWAPRHVLSYAAFAVKVVEVCAPICPAMATECHALHTRLQSLHSAAGR